MRYFSLGIDSATGIYTNLVLQWNTRLETEIFLLPVLPVTFVCALPTLRVAWDLFLSSNVKDCKRFRRPGLLQNGNAFYV